MLIFPFLPLLLFFSLKVSKLKGTRKKMNIHLSSLVFVWLLPLTSCIAMTTQQKHNLGTADDRLATQEASTQGSGPPQSEVTTDVHLKRSPQTFTPTIQKEAAPTFFTWPERNESELAGNATAGPAQVSAGPRSPTTAGTSAGTSPPPSTEASSTSRSTHATSIPMPPLTRTTALVPTTTTPRKQSTNKAGMLPTGQPETTTTTHAAKPQKTKAVLGKKAKPDSNHGAVVGWIIGGTLVLMMLSFPVIYIKKRKLNKQQMTTKDWAGPSPFIENSEGDGQDRARSSQRISHFSFLPQRLSRRLSLLPETEEEMEDINPGTTFGDRHQQASTAQQDVQGRKGAAKTHVSPDVKGTSVQAASPHVDAPTSPTLEAASLSDHRPANGVGEPAQG